MMAGELGTAGCRRSELCRIRRLLRVCVRPEFANMGYLPDVMQNFLDDDDKESGLMPRAKRDKR
jgi:hypothetical protein